MNPAYPSDASVPATDVRDDAPILEIRDLVVEFAGDEGTVRAVDGVAYSVRPGEILGVVGESGSGKSVTAMSVLGLIRRPGRIVGGEIRLRGRDLLELTHHQLREIRGNQVAMIFQDPMTALNPVMTVGAQIVEAVRLHDKKTSRAAARERAVELLSSVGVPNPEVRVRQYPHEFSGGMRQRAMIAIAIANRPELLIADEPTTALDVTVQAQVLDLLRDARDATGAATVIITHDLGVVAELADSVVVMYAGRVVEQAAVSELFAGPRHPYTLGLLSSVPTSGGEDDDLASIPGTPPDMAHPPAGCAFHPRCPIARDRCRTERPPLVEAAPGHRSACHYADELVGATARDLYATVPDAMRDTALAEPVSEAVPEPIPGPVADPMSDMKEAP
ncbi:ABC transporter ATP-binding protein [Yinghuangia sp. YIM S09857]|uniref:ABC transporter ATP-binding protein n=1 Tax=Yinghuangia sp. YIM S09857 TaxID=3436929 RepID=UPI003F52E85B